MCWPVLMFAPILNIASSLKALLGNLTPCRDQYSRMAAYAVSRSAFHDDRRHPLDHSGQLENFAWKSSSQTAGPVRFAPPAQAVSPQIVTVVWSWNFEFGQLILFLCA